MKKLFLVLLLFLVHLLSAQSEFEKAVAVDGNISAMFLDRGSVYLVDGDKALVWKLNQNLEVEKSWALFGEGPRELPGISGLEFTEESIYLFSEGKHLELSRSGEFLAEAKTDGLFAVLNGGERVYSREVFTDDKKLQKIVLQADNREKEVFSIDLTPPAGYFAGAFTFFIRPKAVFGGRGFAVLQPGPQASVEIYSEKGEVTARIRPPGEEIPVSREYRERFFEGLFSDPRFKDEGMRDWVRENVYFPENFPTIQDFYVADRERIFIKTFKRKKDDALFLAYDPEKKELAEIWLPDRGIDLANQSNFTAFSAGRYYYLYCDDQGEYRLYSRGWQ